MFLILFLSAEISCTESPVSPRSPVCDAPGTAHRPSLLPELSDKIMEQIKRKATETLVSAAERSGRSCAAPCSTKPGWSLAAGNYFVVVLVCGVVFCLFAGFLGLCVDVLFLFLGACGGFLGGFFWLGVCVCVFIFPSAVYLHRKQNKLLSLLPTWGKSDSCRFRGGSSIKNHLV